MALFASIMIKGKRKNPDLLIRILSGGRWIRTPDLLITNQLLYRLSYTSVLPARL